MNEAYIAAFANAQLAVERVCGRWRIRVSDLAGREVLHSSAHDTLAAAKTAAVDFVLCRLFGPMHSKDSSDFAKLLAWQESPEGSA
jgi:hypothetical protein